MDRIYIRTFHVPFTVNYYLRNLVCLRISINGLFIWLNFCVIFNEIITTIKFVQNILLFLLHIIMFYFKSIPYAPLHVICNQLILGFDKTNTSTIVFFASLIIFTISMLVLALQHYNIVRSSL